MKFKLFGRLMKSNPSGGAPPQGAQKDRPDPHMLIDDLKARGMPEAEVIKVLKEQGFTFKEIDDALNASLKSEVTGEPPGYAAGMQQQNFGQQQPGGYPQQGQPQFMNAENNPDFHDQYLNEDLLNAENQQFDPGAGAPQFRDSTGMAPPSDGQQMSSDMTMPQDEGMGGDTGTLDDSQRNSMYEIVESVVNERIGVLRTEIKEINEQLKSIQQIIGDFKIEVHESNEAHQREMGSIHDKIKDNITRIGEIEPRVAGLERAFKDIVPNLVDSVREVKEIVNDHLGEDVDAHMNSKKRNKDVFDLPQDDDDADEPDMKKAPKKADPFADNDLFDAAEDAEEKEEENHKE